MKSTRIADFLLGACLTFFGTGAAHAENLNLTAMDDGKVESHFQQLQESVAVMGKKRSIFEIGQLFKGADETVWGLSWDRARYCKGSGASTSSEHHASRLNGFLCTSFLIAPDLMLTAAHCLPQPRCQGETFIFGLNRFRFQVPRSDVYTCKEILRYRYDGNYDYALVRLDRAVSGRAPLTIKPTVRWNEKNRAVFTLGYPAGDSAFLGHGAAYSNWSPLSTSVQTNIPGLGGQSGSPLFDEKSGAVEGIMVKTAADASHRERWNADKQCVETRKSNLIYHPIAWFADEILPFIRASAGATAPAPVSDPSSTATPALR